MAKLIDRDTNKDAIIAYLRDPNGDIESLTTKQRQLLTYYLDGYTLRRNYNSMPDAINILVKMSKATGEVISQSTARRYIVEGQEIFGDVNKLTKQAATHYGLAVLEDAIAMARDQNDPKTMILGAKAYVELSTKDDPELFDASLIERHMTEISLDAKAMKMLDVLSKQGSVDLDALSGNLMNAMAIDAEVVQ